MNLIQSCVEQYGADPSFLLDFKQDTSDLLPYANIVNARSKGDEELNLVDAVYEWQDSPLIFLVDASNSFDKCRLSNLRHKLAMRGDTPYLGVMKKGKLKVHHVALDRKSIDESVVIGNTKSEPDRHLFAELGNTRPTAENVEQNWISKVILQLLNSTLTNLIGIGDVKGHEAISLVGRALVTRFLGDRELLSPKLISSSGPVGELFDNQKNAEATNKWLNRTFNGDFLQLREDVFSKLSEESFFELSNVMRKSVHGQMYLGWEQKWNKLDFAQIPVGILSQAYEAYLKKHDPRLQKIQRAFYTPAQIVNILVKTAIRDAQKEKDIKKIRILDPAAGAGVFLIAAFRELVAEYWRIDGKRPDTKSLRKILENQLTGFEIDESAIRFAALGLYLISIELDTSLGSSMNREIKFNKLRGRVLFNWSENGRSNNTELGSLDPKICKEHKAKYDIVLGNPPWSSKLSDSDNDKIRNHISKIASNRQGDFTLPKTKISSEIAFLLYSMDWAKPNGQIAFALHAGWLFQQGRKMPDIRMAILKSIDVRSIINCAELRQTSVWQNNSAPFCLLIARNQLPQQPVSAFRFINARIEENLNKFGSFRIDISDSEIITVDMVDELPNTLKMFASGTKIDYNIHLRIKSQNFPTLKTLWQDVCKNAKSAGISGVGFSRFGNPTNIELNSDQIKDEILLQHTGLPEVFPQDMNCVCLKQKNLEIFSDNSVRNFRNPEIYKSPLMLVYSVPDKDDCRILTSIANFDVLYSEMIYGYRIGNSRENKLFSKYLYLVVRSKIALWQILMQSGKFGVERDMFQKLELESIQLPDFREFSTEKKEEIEKLFAELKRDEKFIENVDHWLSEQYGLRHWDMEEINETLKFNLPFTENRLISQKPPEDIEIEGFCKELQLRLKKLAAVNGATINVYRHEQNSSSPWKFIEIISNVKGSAKKSSTNKIWNEISVAANSTFSSEIIEVCSDDRLLIGKLRQARYWTISRARLLAKKIAWYYPKIFYGGMKK